MISIIVNQFMHHPSYSSWCDPFSYTIFIKINWLKILNSSNFCQLLISICILFTPDNLFWVDEKMILLSPKNKLSDVIKTYIDIGIGQKFELWVFFTYVHEFHHQSTLLAYFHNHFCKPKSKSGYWNCEDFLKTYVFQLTHLYYSHGSAFIWFSNTFDLNKIICICQVV